MINIRLSLVMGATLLFLYSCKKEQEFPMQLTPEDFPQMSSEQASYTGFPETLETGSKGSYAAADVVLGTGSWNLNDALIGTLASDRKNGLKSLRIQNAGTVTMNFDLMNGVSKVTLLYAVFGTDAASTFELWVSTNSGLTYSKVGSTITANTTSLSTASFNMSISGNARLQIRKLSGGRLNIDDINLDDNSSVPTRDDNLAMGNPSDATTNTFYPNNYLMVKSQYVLSYNNTKGSANWVSWHLSNAWKGSAVRCDCFNIDYSIPSTFFRASTSNYTNTGFDRGHQSPSEDRDGSDADNAATFLMSNIMPQSPNLNRVTWANLENYCRSLISAGNELYIISGGYGSGGSGSLGGITYSFASGKINVPARFWKVIVVLPVGNNDASRISGSTRIIAVDMPNTQTVNNQPWGYYRTSVDAIENATGYNFLSVIPTSIQSVIEASIDNGPTQ